MEYVLASNDEISLVMTDPHYGSVDVYEIIRVEDSEFLGYISYYYENDEIAGNVSYEIFKEYSGHNYAKKALKLFAKNIFKIDDSDLFISILPNNIASIKTAVGAGAVFDRKIDIPLHSTYSLGGKNKYANRYIIKNNKGVNDEKNKIKKHL